MLTQSITFIGSLESLSDATSMRRSAEARRGTRSGPGSTPSVFAIDTGAHGLPDVAEVGVDLLLAVQCQFVLHHHAGQRQAGLAAVVEHFARGVERVRHFQLLLAGLAEVLLVDDEAAADGVVGLLYTSLSPAKAWICMPFSCSGRLSLWKTMPPSRGIDFMQAVGQHQALTLFYIANKTRNAIDIDGVRHIAGRPRMMAISVW